jgi:DNA-binding LacI/PurR family transcriptional regulator/serine phosphatase RsbU (regulator of sigma subunit)
MSKRARARVGLFITGGTYVYQSELIQGAHEECARRGLDLVCLSGGNVGRPDPRNYSYCLTTPADLDAAIMVPGTWGNAPDAPPVRALLEPYLAIPTCVIGARIDGVPSVRIDNEGGVAGLTRHLIEVHGRRRIAFIAGMGAEAVQRQKGYERALREHGIEPDPELLFAGDYNIDSGRAAAERWCSGDKPLCDAIVAANDWMAAGALKEIHARGLHVPRDIALVGFDDIDRARFMAPPLTTIRQTPRLLGIEAVAQIADLLAGTPREQHVMVPALPQIRRSCGCSGLVTTLDAPDSEEEVAPLSVGSSARIAPLLRTELGSIAASLPETWTEELVGAVLEASSVEGADRFLARLSDQAALTAERGNVHPWYRVLLRLREQVTAHWYANGHTGSELESLFARAYAVIDERAELAEAQRLQAREDLMLQLHETSREARMALDWAALCRVLTEHLGRFNVPRFYVATGKSGTPSCQLYVFEQGEARPLPREGIPFASGSIVASEVRPATRTSLVVHALSVHEEVLGHCCLELGPQDGLILKTLSEVISSSLKAAQLSNVLVAEVKRRERAEGELEIAARIQTAVLPKMLEVPGLEIATLMQPASEVGGDYYDILPLAHGCWLGIGDVAGHGLPAGLVMLMIQSIISATVHERADLAPADAWRALNAILTENVRERLGQEEHATLCLLRYHDDGRVRFAGAHEDLLVYRAGTKKVECVPTPGLWLGILPDVSALAIDEGELVLGPGDVLLLHTDGATQARNEAGEQYGIDRLVALLERTGELPAQTIVEHIVHEVGEWMAVQDDDFTLVIVRHRGTPG